MFTDGQVTCMRKTYVAYVIPGYANCDKKSLTRPDSWFEEQRALFSQFHNINNVGLFTSKLFTIQSRGKTIPKVYKNARDVF